MARYIDADVAIAEIRQAQRYCMISETAITAIRAIPAADVAEVKHGYWCEVDSDVGWELNRCSICGKEHSICDGEEKTDYCPNCGAKMDGKDGDGE